MGRNPACANETGQEEAVSTRLAPQLPPAGQPFRNGGLRASRLGHIKAQGALQVLLPRDGLGKIVGIRVAFAMPEPLARLPSLVAQVDRNRLDRGLADRAAGLSKP